MIQAFEHPKAGARLSAERGSGTVWCCYGAGFKQHTSGFRSHPGSSRCPLVAHRASCKFCPNFHERSNTSVLISPDSQYFKMDIIEYEKCPGKSYLFPFNS